MKELLVNRNIIGSMIFVMLLMYGVQGVSYSQDDTLAEFSDIGLAKTIGD